MHNMGFRDSIGGSDTTFEGSFSTVDISSVIEELLVDGTTSFTELSLIELREDLDEKFCCRRVFPRGFHMGKAIIDPDKVRNPIVFFCHDLDLLLENSHGFLGICLLYFLVFFGSVLDVGDGSSDGFFGADSLIRIMGLASAVPALVVLDVGWEDKEELVEFGEEEDFGIFFDGI